MDKEAVLELARFVETCELDFDMREPTAQTHCGSAGCILGHAAMLWPEVRFDNSDLGEPSTLFRCNEALLSKKLGVGRGDVDDLCYPGGLFEDAYDRIKREHAVACLRNLAETGDVDWSEALGEEL